LKPSYTSGQSKKKKNLSNNTFQAGSGEKLFKIFEEWNGNVHLTEQNTLPPVLGTIHQQLRRSVGQAASWVVRSGYV
jgi:hypothetical protein